MLCRCSANKVRNALKQEFPSYDVVEFRGTGPIVDQLKTFATASLIVAPHGAGLANMVASPLHTPVLEIGPLQCSSCYIHLSIKVTSCFFSRSVVGITPLPHAEGTWKSQESCKLVSCRHENKLPRSLRLQAFFVFRFFKRAVGNTALGEPTSTTLTTNAGLRGRYLPALSCKPVQTPTVAPAHLREAPSGQMGPPLR